VFVGEHLRRDAGLGRLTFGYQPWPLRSRMTLLMGLVDSQASQNDVEAALCADAERLGKSAGDVRERQRWDYFPHVLPAEFGAGFHQKLEAAQGRHGIYFAGEMMDFPILERVVRYSRDLVERHFQ